MKHPRLVTLLVVVSLLGVAGGNDPNRANAAVTTLPVVLLVQNGYFVAADNRCVVESGNGDEATFRIVDEDGELTGAFTLNRGQVIHDTGPSGTLQTYCAFVKAVDVGAAGKVQLQINDTFLMSLNLDTFDPAHHLVLEVNSQRLVALEYASESDVRVLGLEPVELSVVVEPTPAGSGTGVTRTPRTGSAEPTPSEASTEITRTPRTSSDQPTSEPVDTPPDASASLRNTRDRAHATTRQTGIVPGEWDLEEPPMLNLLYVFIEEDTVGDGPLVLPTLGEDEIEEFIGFPVLSEEAAPDGCRAFTMQGPYKVVLYVGLCADGDYFVTALGTDQRVVHMVMRDFVDGKPFTIPPGYQEAPLFSTGDVRRVA